MTPKITDEQRQALLQSGRAIAVQDEQTEKMYLLVPEDQVPTLWDEYIRREVARRLESVDRGEVADWDPERIKAEGRPSPIRPTGCRTGR